MFAHILISLQPEVVKTLSSKPQMFIFTETTTEIMMVTFVLVGTLRTCVPAS